MRWTLPSGTGGEWMALAFYLALMTNTCLGLTGASGPTIVEGPFARNDDYLAMLASLHPEGVEVAHSATGTSAGATLLMLRGNSGVATRPVSAPAVAEALCSYAERWRRAAA